MSVGIVRTDDYTTEYSTPVALVMCVLILFTGGFTVFTKGNWSTSGFISSYL